MGTLIMSQSTVFGNRAGDGGPGDRNFSGGSGDGGLGGKGGGVGNGMRTMQGGDLDGIMTLKQCTISGNRAGDGGQAGNIGLGDTSGVGGSGGGFGQHGGSSTTLIEDCIIAGNDIGLGGEGAEDGKALDLSSDFQLTRDGINLIGHNLVDGGVSTAFPSPPFPGQPNGNGDLVGTQGNLLDPLLDPLADNGGPTLTLLPARESPAIDPPMGSDHSLDFSSDQRGFDRVVKGVIDIGAVEAPDYAVIDAEAARQAAVARALRRDAISRKIRKLTKKFKVAKRKRKKRLIRKLKKQIRKSKRQLRAI